MEETSGKRIQDWALQRQGISHFTLHDQCSSDDRHFKTGQSTPLASPYFLNKLSARPFSLLLTSVFPELVFCCFLPQLVTFCGAENKSWHLPCEVLIRGGWGVRRAEEGPAERTAWTVWTAFLGCAESPLAPQHTLWAQSSGLCKHCRNHSHNQNSSYSVGRVGWWLGL